MDYRSRSILALSPAKSLLGCAIGLFLLAASAFAVEPLSYNRDIRPILAENCFICHGPDSGSRKADLRLDKRDAAIEMGAISPGKPDDSVLLDRIFSDDPEQIMPPPTTKKHLTAAQKQLLKDWIAADAKYEPHWSFIAPQKHDLPAVKNAAWVRNGIDAHVLAKLEAMGLLPAPEADRRILARRLSLDLIGLPPKSEWVETFVADQSPNAYEKYVDRLLASPHWGEHRGRYWLDAARYADTNGIHYDNYREMWSYRDWVIQAFNRNQPFDKFTLEQLAGDLLPKRTLEQQIASGFNRCNITTNEGGIIDEEYLVLYTRDRAETTSSVWLGLTAGCAVCHDHKFDPISQREFYELAAFFNNTSQGAKDGNIHNTPPIVQVPLPIDTERLAVVEKQLADTRKQIESRKATANDDAAKWLATVSTAAQTTEPPADEMALYAPLKEGFGNTVDFAVKNKTRPVVGENLVWEVGPNQDKALKIDNNINAVFDDVGDFTYKQRFTFSAWVKLTAEGSGGSIVARMDEDSDYRGWDVWVEGGRVGMHLISSWPLVAIKTVANDPFPVNEWHHLLIRYDGSGKAAGITIFYDGHEQPATVQIDNLRKKSMQTKVPFKLAQRNKTSRLANLQLQDVRLYERRLDRIESLRLTKGTRIASLMQKPAAERTADELSELSLWWLETVDADFQKLQAQEVSLMTEVAKIETRSTVAHVMQERRDPAMAYILDRGEYEKRKDAVKASTLAILPPMADSLPRNRLGFAQWLLLPEHPLTARVTVNRFWQEVFGAGLVRTTGDFGVAGELPINQELLDWLAIEFRENNWDVKKFFKLLVMSNAYRQSAIATPEKLEKDPQNRLLSRGPRFRMDAEMIRDYGLAASDTLVETIGGPSVKPYQPPGVWETVAMMGSNTRDYKQDSGENLYRRSMYTFWKRSAPPASMEIFNAPAREVCTVRRERTNTPLQALMTLNDPQMVEAARRLAETVLKSSPDDDSRIDAIARRLLARPLKPEETAVVKTSLIDLRAYYGAHPDDATQLISVGESKSDPIFAPTALAAWTMLTNELMNLDEVLNK